jgi:hypothetical protein
VRDYVNAIAPAFAVSMMIILTRYILVYFWKFGLTEAESYWVLAVELTVVGAIYFILNCLLSQNIRRLTLSCIPRLAVVKAFLLPDGSP